MEDNRVVQQFKLLEIWLDTQFQPLVFSVDSNPTLGAVMGPYIDSLRDQTRYVAHFYADMVGHREALADSYWRAAQKYVESVGVWAKALSASRRKSFKDIFQMIKEAVPPEHYRRKVAELAEEMWVNSHEYPNPLDIWVSAENHMLTIGARSVANAKSIYEALEILRRAFIDFVAQTYIADIQQRAFFTWKALGEPSGQALDNWLEAERQMLNARAPALFNMEATMKDRLIEVINACKAKTHINVTPDIPVIDLITLHNLGDDDLLRIKTFQKVMHDELGVDIVVVGGGFGSSRITITIKADIQLDNDTADNILKLLLSLDSFRGAAVEAGFPIAMHQNVRVQLDTGNVDVGTDPLGLLVFISYARADDKHCVALEKHLSSLKRQGMISLWHYRAITAGSDWSEEIDFHINMADINALDYA